MSESDYEYSSLVTSEEGSEGLLDENGPLEVSHNQGDRTEPRLILSPSASNDSGDETGSNPRASSRESAEYISSGESARQCPKTESLARFPREEKNKLDNLDKSSNFMEKGRSKTAGESSSSKRRKISDGKLSDDESEEIGFDCPICLTKIINRTYLESCFHQFCFFCISSYIGTCFPNTTCPLCKQTFDKVFHSYKKPNHSKPSHRVSFPEEGMAGVSTLSSGLIRRSSLRNFKVATCAELYKTPVVKTVKSLRELCLELNKRDIKTPRDRQLIYEYSLVPCFSKATSKRLAVELAKDPYIALDDIDFSGFLCDQESNDFPKAFHFLKRDVTAILLINHPLFSESLLSLTLRQVLSTLAFNPGEKSSERSFQERSRTLDQLLFPFSEAFLKELTGFLVSPFYSSLNALQQYDKWINYEEP